MNAFSTATAAALLATAAATVVLAQTPPDTAPPDPNAASSPHQRQTVHASTDEAQPVNGAEPSAASTPHQHEAMAGASPETFVREAAQDGMTEVELAKLAMQKSSNDQVKQFAQKMLHDHSQASSELQSIAKAKGLSVPDKLDAKHETMVQQLSAKSGAAFDAAYAAAMAKGHNKAVALFKAATLNKDPELAAFAKKTLPTLEDHKQLADNLHANVRTRTASSQ
jgi:putative membrane protein